MLSYSTTKHSSFFFTFRVPHLTSQPWFDKNDTKENNLRARKAYTAMLTVTPKQPNDDEYTRVSNEVSFC